MAAVIKIEINSSSTGGGLREAAADIERLDGAARNASGKGGGVGIMGAAVAGALGGAAVAAAGAAASAIGGMVTDSVSLAGQFEGGMNEFAAAAGGSLEAAGMDVQQFQDLFLQLGAKLPVSTMEVQQAAIALVKGGIDPAIIAAGGLESSLNFASAAGMGLEDAANLSVKMLGTFTSVTDSAATKTEFMADAQNLLVKAANASTLDVATLGDAMLAAGGQAKAVGLDYEDFVTTMGLISPSFGSAAEAGTSFKNFLVRLQPTTGPATKAMQSLGLYTEEAGSAFFDANGKFVGVETAAELLQNSLSGLSDAQRVMALQTIFGNDAMGAAAALADGGSEAYRAFAEQMGLANDVSEQSTAVNQGFDFAMQNLQGTFESIKIQIGLAFLPTLTMLVTLLNNTINAVMGSTEAFDQLPGPLQVVVTFIRNLIDGAKNLITWWQEMTHIAWISAGGFGAIPKPLQIIFGLIGDVTRAFRFLGELFAPLVAAFQWFGMSALREIITFVTTGESQFAAFNAIWLRVKAFVSEGLGAIIGYLQTNLPIWIAALTQWGTALWQWVENVLPVVLAQLGVLVQQLVMYLQTNLPIWVATLTQWATASWQWIVTVTPIVVTFLEQLLGNIIAYLQANLPGWIAALAQWAKAIVDWIVEAYPKVIEQVFIAVGGIIAYVGSQLPTWLTTLAQWANALWKWVQDALPIVIQQLGAWALQIITWIGEKLPDLLVTLLQWGTAMYKWLADAIPPLIIELGKFIAAMMNPLDNDAKNRINEWATNAANALWKWITDDLVPKVGPALGEFLSALVDYLGSMLAAIGTAAKSIGGAIMDGIAAGLEEKIESTKRALKGAVDAVIEIAKKVLDMRSPSRVMAEEVGMPIAQGMAMGIMQGVPMVAQAGSAMAQSAMMGAQSNVTYQYNYSPVYSSMPSNPSLDFQLMRSLARV
jgi:TP901 family phage tail tape measure protein